MDVFKMLAAILHLGNVEIAAVGDERSSISVRKQLIQLPTFSILFYGRSALAIVSLISGAQSSIKSGVLNLTDFSISICVESESVHTDAVLCPASESINKRQNVAKSAPHPIDPQLLENPFWSSLQDAGNRAQSKLLKMCPSKLCKSERQEHLKIDQSNFLSLS